MAPPLSAMNGLLTRTSDGWRWRDGTPEPRVRDLSAGEAFQLPTVSHPHPEHAGQVEWVRIPNQLIEEEPDLAEFVSGLGVDAQPSPFEPEFTEVPAEAWDRFAPTVIGIVWEPEHETALFETADALQRRVRA